MRHLRTSAFTKCGDVQATGTPRKAAALSILRRLRDMSSAAADGPASMVRIRSNGDLLLNLNGEVGKYDARARSGILATHVEAVLRRHPRAANVEVTINSPGGDLPSAVRLYHLLRSHPAHVTAIADDVCSSSATVILMAGDFRQAWSDAKLLFHAPEINPVHSQASERWTLAKYNRIAKRLAAAEKEIIEIYAERTGNREFFAREIKNEAHLPLAIAKAHGAIHCLVGEETWIAGRPYYS